MRVAVLLACAAGVACVTGACDKSTSTSSGPGAARPPMPDKPPPATPATPPTPASYVCDRDADCEVSCARPKDCCGQLCECTRIYHRDQLEAIRKANDAACPDKPDCPRADCPYPEHETLAVCRNHACAGVKVERLSSCKTDDDCVTSPIVRGSCCDQECAGMPYDQAYPKADLPKLEAWRQANCTGDQECPMAKCDRAYSESVARCRYGECTVEWVK